MLRKLREKKKLTQEQLAYECGVTKQTISAIENKVNKPSVKLAKKLGQVLECDWVIFFIR